MANKTISLPARKRYRKDIVLVLALKVLALFALWSLFFAHPLKPLLTKEVLDKHFTAAGRL